MIQIFHNPRCSKSRQTLQLIVEAQQEVEVVEYLHNPPAIEELRSLVKALDLPASDLVRSGEAVFAELGIDLTSLSDDAVIELIAAHPVLMQRPIVVGNGKAIIGRPPENVLSLWS
ncbi:MAG: arsenate reductase (glutaredoxin) [Planctomycetaceae bacterium]|nr:arsenate reductase (glutaredoxin) [Planctomycetaceae bacterium]